MRRMAHPIFHRHIMLLPTHATLPQGHPAHGKQALDGTATAYICPGQSCLPPITEAAALSQALDALVVQRQSDEANIKGVDND